MFKTFFALAATLLVAATTFAAGAEAGCGKRHGGFRSQTSSYQVQKARRARARRAALIAAQRRRAIAKKKAAAKAQAVAQRKLKAKKIRIAKAKAKAKAEAAKAAKVAAAEKANEPFDKPVSVAALAGADITDEAEEVVEKTTKAIDPEAIEEAQTSSNENVGCKKYVPAAGLTITVPCA